MATLGQRIQEARLAVGLSQREAALKICPTGNKDVYRKYESGARKPPHEVLKKMGRTFRVPLAYFDET